MSEPIELYRKYRPANLSDVVGQKDVVSTLTDLGKRKALPHCVLFTGPSGVGKTTIIRILKTKLKCGDHDYVEINAAESRGIDTVRDIQQRMSLAPMGGKCRVWAVDECHKLTGDAQSALLKTLEDTPSHVYFMLATTDPQKLLPTIKTRCTEFRLRGLKPDELTSIVEHVTGAEGKKLTAEVVERLVEVADGSARKCLVLLHAIIGLEGEEEQLDAIQKSDSRRQAFEIARLLIKPNARWNEMAKLLQGIEALNEQAESIRWMVLSYMSTVALKNPKLASRAVEVIDRFRDHWYDCKQAGLILVCYDLLSGGK